MAVEGMNTSASASAAILPASSTINNINSTTSGGKDSKQQKRKRRARKKKSQKSKDASSSVSNKPNSNGNGNGNGKSNKSNHNNNNTAGNNNNSNNNKTQAVHLPHAKITLRNIRNNEKNGTAESMIQLLKELIQDRNQMKFKLKSDDMSEDSLILSPPLNVLLDHTCLENIMDRVHQKKSILNQQKERKEGKEESSIGDVNADVDVDADADQRQNDNHSHDADEHEQHETSLLPDMDMKDSCTTTADTTNTEKDEPIVDIHATVDSAGISNAQMNEDNSDAMAKQNPHSISARLLYLIPPKISRRRGELSGHCYLALYPPMPIFIQEKLKLIQEEKDLAMVKAIAMAKQMKESNMRSTCSVGVSVIVGQKEGEGESVHVDVPGEGELTVDVDMDGNQVDTSSDHNTNTGAVVAVAVGDGDGDGDGDGGEEAQSVLVNTNESASVNESTNASASANTLQEKNTDDIASPIHVQPLEMQQEQKQTKPETKITAADRSKALAQSRLLLSETLASLAKLCKDDSKKDKPYSGIHIEMSSNQKIWKAEEKGNGSGTGGGSGREGRKFGMAAKYDSTIEQNDDFKQFLDSKKMMEEELNNRPKPPPGGGPLAEMTNIGTGTGVDDRMGSAGGDPVSAIVMHLREKKEAALKAKKKANAEKKKATKVRGGGDRGKKAGSAGAVSGGKADGEKSKKKSKRKSKAKKGESTKKDVASAPKLLLKK